MTRGQIPDRRRRATAAWAAWVVTPLLLAAPGAGCGNYSNEDLEFMSVLPVHDDVSVEVPRQASLTAAGAPEGWLTTLRVSHDLNGAADAFLSLIDLVRSYSPTSRSTNMRVWGPFPADRNPGWQAELTMTKVDGPPPSFTYELLMIPPSGTPPYPIIQGGFDAAGGLRLGTGELRVNVVDARAAGAVFMGLEQIQTLDIAYSNQAALRHVQLDILPVPPADPTMNATSVRYVFERAANGDGAMTFNVLQNIVTPGPALETLSFATRWLASGRGRTDISITGGDAPPGAATTECWDDVFSQTYTLQSWARDQATGDPASCISPL